MRALPPVRRALAPASMRPALCLTNFKRGVKRSEQVDCALDIVERQLVDRKAPGATLYPVACTPQAWASGTAFQLLQSLLGLEFDSAACKVELWDPFLPASVNEIRVRNLGIGASSTDFVVRCDDGKPSLRVLRTTGQISVLLKTANPT
jgi:hypothetical protein